MEISNLVDKTDVAKTSTKEKFSPEYKLVEDYFNPNPLTSRTCTMSRMSKKLSYNQ